MQVQGRLLHLGFALFGVVQIALLGFAVRSDSLGIGPAIGIAAATALIGFTIAFVARARLLSTPFVERPQKSGCEKRWERAGKVG